MLNETLEFKMRLLSLICMLLIGAHAHADETVMHCTSFDTEKEYTFKLVSRLFGKDEIFQREDGGWDEWCPDKDETTFMTLNDIEYEVRRKNSLKIGDKGGKCVKKTDPLNTAYSNDIGAHITEIVDFYLKTFVFDAHKLIGGKNDHRKFKWEFNCKPI
jgi:hypothetical protein